MELHPSVSSSLSSIVLSKHKLGTTQRPRRRLTQFAPNRPTRLRSTLKVLPGGLSKKKVHPILEAASLYKLDVAFGTNRINRAGLGCRKWWRQRGQSARFMARKPFGAETAAGY